MTSPKEFAILLNNMDRTANFDGSEQILDFIDCLYQVAAFDAEASRTRMFIETHFYPTEQQKQRIREHVDSLNETALWIQEIQTYEEGGYEEVRWHPDLRVGLLCGRHSVDCCG